MARTRPSNGNFAFPTPRSTPDVSPETSAQRAPSEAADTPFVTLELPVAAEVHDPLPHYVEVQLRTPETRAGLARLRDGMIAAGATCGGRPVESAADALRAFLEQIAAN